MAKNLEGSMQNHCTDIVLYRPREVICRDLVVYEPPETTSTHLMVYEPPPSDSEQPLLLEMKNTAARRSRTTVVSVTSVYFERIIIPEDPVEYKLYAHEVIEPSAADMTQVNEFQSLPILKDWKIEIRQRQDGTKDKFYHHPSSSKPLRSMVEVKNLVDQTLNPQNAQSVEGLQDSLVGRAEASKLNERKRKCTSSAGASRRERVSKERASRVEEWLLQGYNNLLNMSSATPVKATPQKELVETFLAEARRNLDSLENEDKLVDLPSFNILEAATPEAIPDRFDELVDEKDAGPLNEQDPEHLNDLTVLKLGSGLT